MIKKIPCVKIPCGLAAGFFICRRKIVFSIHARIYNKIFILGGD
jgi:hypothetical protein